ncbi:MAG: phosphate signaling complex protein PhoU [Chloroflexota bacterium]
MTREILDRKIRHLLDEILVLDSMIEQATLEAVDALRRHDLEKARQVYAGDKLINARRFELENDVIVTIATQQPIMAGDLRLMASILEVVSELERIGDYAKGIAKVTVNLGTQAQLPPLALITRMSEITLDMLHRAVGAFVAHDAPTARQIPLLDDQVDALYNQVYAELVQLMIADPSKIDQANHLMWAAHNLERMADRVSNICERTIYIVTGQLVEIDA